MGVTYNQIIRDIQLKKFAPVYVLTGEEPFFIDEIAHSIENDILDESEKSFGLSVVYGRDSELSQVINLAKGFPMMGNYQIVMIKEAQDLKEWKKSDSLKPLENYINQPTPTTIFVLEYKGKTLDKRLSITKLIEKKTVHFVSEKIKDNQLDSWIYDYVTSRGFKINRKIAELLSDYLGNDLSKIVNEINKIAIIFPAGTEINSDIIQDYVGISKEYNIFELQNALAEKNIIQANRIIEYFVRNPKSMPIPMLVGSLFGFFNKVNIIASAENKTYTLQKMYLGTNQKKDVDSALRNYSAAKLDRIIGYLYDTDKKSKGIGKGQMSDGEILLELTFKILH
jgi:DNA polymerase-3 subunit delta